MNNLFTNLILNIKLWFVSVISALSLTPLNPPTPTPNPEPSPSEIVSQTPTPTQKKRLPTPSPTPSIVSTSSPTPTPIDWVKFEEDLKNKLSNIPSSTPTPIQTTSPQNTLIPTQSTNAYQLNEDDLIYDFSPKDLSKSNTVQKVDFSLTFLKDFDYAQITSVTFYLVDETNNINRTPTFMRYMYNKEQNRTITDAMTTIFQSEEKYVMNKILIVYKNGQSSNITIDKNLKYLEIK